MWLAIQRARIQMRLAAPYLASHGYKPSVCQICAKQMRVVHFGHVWLNVESAT